jgi:hypothetical protein
MLQKKREYRLGYGELLLYRLWTALSSGVMEGLVCMDMPSIPTTVEEFLAEYRFDSPTDEENSGSGYTPLIFGHYLWQRPCCQITDHTSQCECKFAHTDQAS